MRTMSRAAKLDTAPEKRKPKDSPQDGRLSSESRPKVDESSLRVENEAWVATPAPDFLLRSEPPDEKGKPAAGLQAGEEPATVHLTPEPARARKNRLRRPASLASYAFYAGLFVATAAASAAVVLFVL